MQYYLTLPYSETSLQQRYRVRVRDLRAIELRLPLFLSDRRALHLRGSPRGICQCRPPLVRCAPRLTQCRRSLTRTDGIKATLDHQRRCCQGVRMHHDSGRADLAPKVAEGQGQRE